MKFPFAFLFPVYLITYMGQEPVGLLPRCESISVLVGIEFMPFLPPKVYEISGGCNPTDRAAERFPFKIAFTFWA
jgi:hypothetical protein